MGIFGRLSGPRRVWGLAGCVGGRLHLVGSLSWTDQDIDVAARNASCSCVLEADGSTTWPRTGAVTLPDEKSCKSMSCFVPIRFRTLRTRCKARTPVRQGLTGASGRCKDDPSFPVHNTYNVQYCWYRTWYPNTHTLFNLGIVCNTAYSREC